MAVIRILFCANPCIVVSKSGISFVAKVGLFSLEKNNYHWIRHYLPEFQAVAAGKATTLGRIQRHHLSDLLILVPDDRFLQSMDKILSPMFNQKVENTTQSNTLTRLRDTLLPKLLSGQIGL